MPLRRTTLAPAVTRVQAQVVAAGVTAGTIDANPLPCLSP